MTTPDSTYLPTGTTGLIFNEPLLWEQGAEGRCGMSVPESDVLISPLDSDLVGEGPDWPNLSELDVVRHFTRMSQWNFGVDSNMYPLGSCTMKYNPKINERQAALPGLAGAHPLVPSEPLPGRAPADLRAGALPGACLRFGGRLGAAGRRGPG